VRQGPRTHSVHGGSRELGRTSRDQSIQTHGRRDVDLAGRPSQVIVRIQYAPVPRAIVLGVSHMILRSHHIDHEAT
jgi:hypothetical protein